MKLIIKENDNNVILSGRYESDNSFRDFSVGTKIRLNDKLYKIVDVEKELKVRKINPSDEISLHEQTIYVIKIS